MPNAEGVPVSEDLTILLRCVADRDAESFEQLYRLTSPRVFGLVCRIVVNRTISEEVTQEVFLEIWSKAASFDPSRGSALAWMLTIARGRSIDRVRSEVSSTARTTVWARKEQLTDYDPVLEDVLAQDETRQLTACLAHLTPVQREAIDLAYFGGLTYAEVAERLGAAPGTVKSRIRDGIIRLHRELAPLTA